MKITEGKAIVVSHNDLDGIGSIWALRKILSSVKISIKETYQVGSPNKLLDKLITIERVVKEENISSLFITDLAISTKFVEPITRILKANPGLAVIWIDHHSISTDDLDKIMNTLGTNSRFSLANSPSYSASYLICDVFDKSIECKTNRLIEVLKYIRPILKVISDYDTFAFKDVDVISIIDAYSKLVPEALNAYFSIYGCEKVWQQLDSAYVKNKQHPEYSLEDYTDLTLHHLYANIYECAPAVSQWFIDRKNFIDNTINRIVVDKDGVARIISDSRKYISELGYVVCHKYPEIINYLEVYDTSTECFQLRSSKLTDDVSKIAKGRNGGGHKKAAGYPATPELVRSFIESMVSSRKLVDIACELEHPERKVVED